MTINSSHIIGCNVFVISDLLTINEFTQLLYSSNEFLMRTFKLLIYNFLHTYCQTYVL